MITGDNLEVVLHPGPVWEEMVPAEAARIVKERKLFGYRPSPTRS